MATYVVVYGDPLGIGLDDALALVVDDGALLAVYGTSDTAKDLRASARDIGGDDAAHRLAVLTHGLAYFRVDGPHSFEGDTAEAGPVLAHLYGLTS